MCLCSLLQADLPATTVHRELPADSSLSFKQKARTCSLEAVKVRKISNSLPVDKRRCPDSNVPSISFLVLTFCSQFPSDHCIRVGPPALFAIPSSGAHLATGSSDATVRVWSLESGLCWKTLCSHTTSVAAVAWSPTNDLLASGSDDGTARTPPRTPKSRHPFHLQIFRGSVRGMSADSWVWKGCRGCTRLVRRRGTSPALACQRCCWWWTRRWVGRTIGYILCTPTIWKSRQEIPSHGEPVSQPRLDHISSRVWCLCASN